jgi:hypothetical protein
MKAVRQPVLFAAALAAALWCAPVPPAAAQDQQVLMPEQSEAKAKQLIQRAIDAMGGSAFVNVHDLTCTGNIGQFDHSGQLSGFEKFVQYTEPPLKDRVENLPQHNVIDVFNGDEGWSLDRGGVSDEPALRLVQHQDDVAKSLDNILLRRVDEPTMDIHYDGKDIVDLKQVDWVQLVDADDRTIRIAFDRETHLPIRKTVESRDPKLNSDVLEVEYYSNYYSENGVQLPKQITRERNNLKIYQVFFDSCSINTGVQDSFFTKQSLEDRWAKMPNHEKYRDKNKKGGSNTDVSAP